MRITLSGAMRARDVSRPSDEQLAAAAKREQAAGRTDPASGPAHVTAAPAAPAVTPVPAGSTTPSDPRPARRRRRRRG